MADCRRGYDDDIVAGVFHKEEHCRVAPLPGLHHRYNVYYNGDAHFKETLKEMEQNYEDDYSQRLFLHPPRHGPTPSRPAERLV